MSLRRSHLPCYKPQSAGVRTDQLAAAISLLRSQLSHRQDRGFLVRYFYATKTPYPTSTTSEAPSVESHRFFSPHMWFILATSGEVTSLAMATLINFVPGIWIEFQPLFLFGICLRSLIRASHSQQHLTASFTHRRYTIKTPLVSHMAARSSQGNSFGRVPVDMTKFPIGRLSKRKGMLRRHSG